MLKIGRGVINVTSADLGVCLVYKFGRGNLYHIYSGILRRTAEFLT